MEQEISFSRSFKVILDNLAYKFQISPYLSCTQQHPLLSYYWVKLNSVRFHKKQTVMLCPARGAIKYRFGLVHDILTESENALKIVIVCRMFRTICYSDLFEAYHVELMKNYC